MKEVVITGIARTPIGSFQGVFADVPAVELGAEALRQALLRSQVPGADVDEVIMGQVLTAGAGQAPARQATLGAGLPDSVPCTTVNKVCGSGLQSIMLARKLIALGEANIVVAGGMESMTRAPYLLPEAREGYRMGNKQLIDSMMHDGLRDPFADTAMGDYGEFCAEQRGDSREEQDAYAIRSYERALAAQEAGHFNDEIVPIQVTTKRQTSMVDRDEEPGRFFATRFRSCGQRFPSRGRLRRRMPPRYQMAPPL